MLAISRVVEKWRREGVIMWLTGSGNLDGLRTIMRV